MLRSRRFSAVALAALAVAASSAAPAAAKQIVVDCTKDSIQDALSDKAADLTIVVNGWCNEHVVIRRPVVLRGFSGDPSLDGIVGPGAGGDVGLVQVIDVLGSAPANPVPENFGVYLQDLGIRDSERAGLFTAHVEIGLRNVRITDNASDGGSFTFDSFVVAEDVVFANNGGSGFNVRRAAVVSCSSCEIDGNGGFGVNANNDGIAALFDGSTITGLRGASANNDGHVQLDVGTTVSGTIRALSASAAGDIDLFGATVDGSILCAIDGRFTYDGLTQTANPNSNVFFAGCNFFGEGTATFTGHTVFEGPIHGVAHGPVTFGTLACEGPHSDLICYAGATHASSTCGSCP